LLDKFTGTNQ